MEAQTGDQLAKGPLESGVESRIGTQGCVIFKSLIPKMVFRSVAEKGTQLPGWVGSLSLPRDLFSSLHLGETFGDEAPSPQAPVSAWHSTLPHPSPPSSKPSDRWGGLRTSMSVQKAPAHPPSHFHRLAN